MAVIRSRAPLRISFAGGGTDVSPYLEAFGGIVVSTTIDRYAYVTIKKNTEGSVRVYSQDYNLVEIFKSISDMNYGTKLDLVKSALRYMGVKDQGIDIILQVDSPPGSGLGSSSALTVALIGALMRLKNEQLSLYEIAETAYHIERKEAGIKGGMQDQYAATFGGFNFIEFKKDSVTVNPLRLRPEIQNELLASLVLCDTRSTRVSAKILHRQIESYKKKESEVIQSLHHIKQLASDLKDALVKGNMANMGQILDESWRYKKKLDSKISDEKIDDLYHRVLTAGAKGGKLLGAGAGGHMIFCCALEDRQRISKEITIAGCQAVKFNFDIDGLKVWETNNGVVVA